MIELLRQNFPCHYGLRKRNIIVPNETTHEEYFDLTDRNETMLVPYKTGNVSFNHSKQTEIVVINYEKFLNGLSGTAFERGRKRCDFILYEAGGSGDGFFLLNEQTSTLGTTDNLFKPIVDKDKNVIYPKGKYEKVEVQLSETLKTLKAVADIKAFIDKYQCKICLMSYVITPKQQEEVSNARYTFSARYRQVEARVTGENGAKLELPAINAEGFEYRRISHTFSFKLS